MDVIFVLIMTLNFKGDAVAMETLETASKQECITVGNAWYDNLHYASKSSFVCVKMTKVR